VGIVPGSIRGLCLAPGEPPAADAQAGSFQLSANPIRMDADIGYPGRRGTLNAGIIQDGPGDVVIRRLRSSPAAQAAMVAGSCPGWQTMPIELPAAVGQRPGFIENHRVDGVGPLEGLDLPDQNAPAAGQGDAGQPRHGNGHPQGAGAGDDHHGHRPHHGLVDGAPGQKTEQAGTSGQVSG
jgi:hypothetical protein